MIFQVQTFGDNNLLSLAGWYDYSFVPEKSKEAHLRTKNTSGLIEDWNVL